MTIQEQLDNLTKLFKFHKHLGTDMSQKFDPQKAIALGTTGAVTMNPLLGNVFTITPTAAVQLSVSNFIVGIYSLVVLTSGTTSYVIDFQTGFTTTATLSTGVADGRYFTITFVCDGVGMREIARTVAMLPF